MQSALFILHAGRYALRKIKPHQSLQVTDTLDMISEQRAFHSPLQRISSLPLRFSTCLLSLSLKASLKSDSPAVNPPYAATYSH